MVPMPRRLRCEDLIAFDVVPSLIEAAHSTGFSDLLPLQEEACRAGIFASQTSGERPADLMLVGSSKTGKKTVCEIAAIHHALLGTRVLVVVHDLRAAARCVARLEAYKVSGLRVGLCGEVSDFAGLDLAVASLEAASEVLSSDAPATYSLGLVVVEDLEEVADGLDSELWPLLLLRCHLWRQELRLRLVLLSRDASFGHSLAETLRAKVVSATEQIAQTPAPAVRSFALFKLRAGLRASPESAENPENPENPENKVAQSLGRDSACTRRAVRYRN